MALYPAPPFSRINPVAAARTVAFPVTPHPPCSPRLRFVLLAPDIQELILNCTHRATLDEIMDLDAIQGKVASIKFIEIEPAILPDDRAAFVNTGQDI